METQGSTGSYPLTGQSLHNAEFVLSALRTDFPAVQWLNVGVMTVPHAQEYQGTWGGRHHNFLKATVNANGLIKIMMLNSQTNQVVGKDLDPFVPVESKYYAQVSAASQELKQKLATYRVHSNDGVDPVLNA